jgi:hypothetical protein
MNERETENVMDNINVDILAADWLSIKAEEKALTAKRHAIEEQIAAALEVKDEGSISHKLDGHKVTLTQPVSRKVDTQSKQPSARMPLAVVICWLMSQSCGPRSRLPLKPKLAKSALKWRRFDGIYK